MTEKNLVEWKIIRYIREVITYQWSSGFAVVKTTRNVNMLHLLSHLKPFKIFILIFIYMYIKNETFISKRVI